MTKQLRDAAALIKHKGIPVERITEIELTRERTKIILDFATDEDAAIFGSTKLQGGTQVQKLETNETIRYSTEVSFREHIYIFVLFVQKELNILAQS